jgi:hypothetical protein
MFQGKGTQICLFRVVRVVQVMQVMQVMGWQGGRLHLTVPLQVLMTL